jgi:hypothetical protein
MNNKGRIVTVRNSINAVYVCVIRMAFNLFESAVDRTGRVQGYLKLCWAACSLGILRGIVSSYRYHPESVYTNEFFYSFLIARKLNELCRCSFLCFPYVTMCYVAGIKRTPYVSDARTATGFTYFRSSLTPWSTELTVPQHY